MANNGGPSTYADFPLPAWFARLTEDELLAFVLGEQQQLRRRGEQVAVRTWCQAHVALELARRHRLSDKTAIQVVIGRHADAIRDYARVRRAVAKLKRGPHYKAKLEHMLAPYSSNGVYVLAQMLKVAEAALKQ